MPPAPRSTPTALGRLLGRDEVTLVVAALPGVSAQQPIVLREAFRDLGIASAAGDIEPDPDMLGFVEALAAASACEIGADAFGSPETRALDDLERARGVRAAEQLAIAEARRERAVGALEEAERALEEVLPARAPVFELVVGAVLTLCLCVLTGLALGATAEAAGLKLSGALTPAMLALPWIAGVLYGVGGGLALVIWGGQQARGWHVLHGAIGFALPMVGLALLRIGAAWTGNAGDVEAIGDEVFKGGVLAAVEIGGVVGVAKAADAWRRLRSAWASASDNWCPFVQRRSGCLARLGRAEAEIAAAERALDQHHDVVRERTCAHRTGEKLATLAAASARYGHALAAKQTRAGLVGFADHAPRLVTDLHLVRPQ